MTRPDWLSRKQGFFSFNSHWWQGFIDFYWNNQGFFLQFSGAAGLHWLPPMAGGIYYFPVVTGFHWLFLKEARPAFFDSLGNDRVSLTFSLRRKGSFIRLWQRFTCLTWKEGGVMLLPFLLWVGATVDVVELDTWIKTWYYVNLLWKRWKCWW
jgi:hypothetical protein